MIASLVTAILCLLPGDGDWPHWRGPDGTGVARTKAPLAWSDDENVKWKVEIPGLGYSTPVVWQGKIYLTTAVPLEEPEVEEPPPSEGGERGVRRAPRVRHGEQSFDVLCLDRVDGKAVWRQTAVKAKPHEGYHLTYGSFASASPITDGERLYVSFGSQGLYCYDLAGKLLWKKDPGVKLFMRNAFGEGLAPIVHAGTLVQVYDHEQGSFILALDAKTGEQRWRADRDEPSSWATPLVVEQGGQALVVTTATNRVRAYDLATGAVVWQCGGLGTNAIPNPLRHGDTVLAMSGHRDPNLIAIQLGKQGDLTGTDAVKWSQQKGLAYTASPVLYQGRLYAVMDRGFISCWDAATGEPVLVEERLPRGSTLKASPVVADGHLYVPTESGDVHVIDLSQDYDAEKVVTNTLAEQFFIASPAVVDGELFLRSKTHLFCIASVAKGVGQ
jgi:outer membrane protein assembly factor BamB